MSALESGAAFYGLLLGRGGYGPISPPRSTTALVVLPSFLQLFHELLFE